MRDESIMMTTTDPSFDLRHTLSRSNPSLTGSPTDRMDIDPPADARVTKDVPKAPASLSPRSGRSSSSRPPRLRSRDRHYRRRSRSRETVSRRRDEYPEYDSYQPSRSSRRHEISRYESDRRRYERRSYRYESPPPPPPRDRHRDESRNGLNRPAPVPDLTQPERDQRTVFVAQLHLQARPRDIAEFFEKLDTGSVRDVKLVADRGSRRGKGVGFVEFYELESVDKALAHSGQLLLGVPIIVERTEAEKNRLALAAAAEKTKLLAQANAAAAVPGLRQWTTSASGGAQNNFQFSSRGIATLPPRPAFVVDKPESISKTLCVEKLPTNLTSSDIRQIFEPFGAVTNVHIVVDHDGKSTGTAHVSFSYVDACHATLAGLKGFVIGDHEIVCSLYVDQSLPSQGGGEPEELEEKVGVRMNAQSRVELMTKLARTESLDIPSTNGTYPTTGLSPSSTVASTATPTRCLLLTNMFDPAQETEPNWDRDIEVDVKDECERQYGPVRHIHLVRQSAGHVFVKFAGVDACSRALGQLNGRLFAGNRVTAVYISESEYNSKFPDATTV